MSPLFCCPCSTLVSPRLPSLSWATLPRISITRVQRYVGSSMNSDCLKVVPLRSKHQLHWSFIGGSRIQHEPRGSRIVRCQRGFRPSASYKSYHLCNIEFSFQYATCYVCLMPNRLFDLISSSFKFLVIGLTSSQIASNAFTWGTVAVLPFYTLMVLAPKASFVSTVFAEFVVNNTSNWSVHEHTRRTMESSVPYIALGVLYAYLLYLSWTPDTFRMMFATGIAKMFTNELTVASAWIHLLAVDLFAAR
ncbi:unnamed protein product, partial [Musa hybrid cultivar]